MELNNLELFKINKIKEILKIVYIYNFCLILYINTTFNGNNIIIIYINRNLFIMNFIYKIFFNDIYYPILNFKTIKFINF